ncbi:hypothetical protein QJS66_12420 [Kocuria rhizophila]|nr:hypothetical protein QJS66_12420 [Kocuria rhizophila]
MIRVDNRDVAGPSVRPRPPPARQLLRGNLPMGSTPWRTWPDVATP